VPESVLLIDQGNTRLKWVLARDGEILKTSAGRGDSTALAAAFEGSPATLNDILFSSVAGPEAVRQVTEFCHGRWRITPRRLESKSVQGGVHCAYADPVALGVDRWLAIVGAVARYGKPIVIWDLGTATTLDAVDQNGDHLGGMILPGPATMLNSLRRDTRLRVPDDLSKAQASAGQGEAGVAPGADTAACISRGVLAAQLGALNQYLRHVARRMGSDPELVVTGGAAEQVVDLLDMEYHHDPWLVFRGMLVD
jgi:type III pantothenate kinase